MHNIAARLLQIAHGSISFGLFAHLHQPGRSNRGSRFADMTLLRKDGSLLQ